MTAFHTIAVPHEDILAGRLTMDVFAADLWEVYQGRAPDEYQDAARFFQKTFITDGLQNLLDVVRRRLEGEGGDPVIQIQTPFGGGKTHALIAMYHRAREWGATPAVLVGTAMPASETLWGLLAEQIAGTRAGFEGETAPGKEALRGLLEQHQPLLILMDEVLEYATKAAGVRVGESTLASQMLAFLQELTEVAGTLDRVCVVVTLPASVLEHYDEAAERLFQRVQRVAGRVEKIYTPVQEHEISQVIRRRLFSHLDERKMHEVVGEFLTYAERENLLPAGVEPSEYRDRFRASYPFLPEVIDVLYGRWGSFVTFQRTRGVLRLLSLVVSALKDSALPYITLGDFNLADQEIRRELLKHIGPEYDSVIGADITAPEAGARRVDRELGDAYRGLHLGTRSATAIFMYSFSGGTEKGATLAEVKRQATIMDNPSRVIDAALEMLKSRLFYIQESAGRVFFANQPNLNRILLTQEENVSEEMILAEEHRWLEKSLGGPRFRTFIWPEQDGDIPDDAGLKLLILPAADTNLMRRFVANKGQTPRVHRNTLFFLTPVEHYHQALRAHLRRYVALTRVQDEKFLALTREQVDELRGKKAELEKDLPGELRRAYRHVYTPAGGDDVRLVDLGMPAYGDTRRLEEAVYESLRSQQEILERVEPLVLKERYLRTEPHLSTRILAESWSKAPGALRVPSEHAWQECIRQGVEKGLFGLGRVDESGQLHLEAFKEAPAAVSLAEDEVIIRADIAEDLARHIPIEGEAHVSDQPAVISGTGHVTVVGTKEAPPATSSEVAIVERIKGLRLKFSVPFGKTSDIMNIINALMSDFGEITLEITAEKGDRPGMLRDDYEITVREAFRQLDIEPEEDMSIEDDPHRPC